VNNPWPPGFYRDMQGIMRWWDGTQWTEQVQNAPDQAGRPIVAPARVWIGFGVTGLALAAMFGVGWASAHQENVRLAAAMERAETGASNTGTESEPTESATASSASGTFSDGVHVVGTGGVAPGSYATTSADSCYYAWLSDTGADADIIDNNLIDGDVTVTLAEGDVFESNGCGAWTPVEQ
jgi:hypothetical protein